MHDTKAGIFVAVGAYRKYGMLKAFSADAGYRGSFISNVEEILGLPVDISEKIVPRGFHVIKNRWKEERTFAWLSHSRLLSKDFEITTASSETMIKISHLHTLLKRL